MIFQRKHVHDLQPVALWHHQVPLSPAVTIVLRRCACSALDTDTLPGRWTIADILGLNRLDLTGTDARPPAPPPPQVDESVITTIEKGPRRARS